MEPRSDSVRDTASTAALVHNVKQDNVEDKPIPIAMPEDHGPAPAPSTPTAPARQWYPVTKLLATTIERKQRFFKVVWEEPTKPASVLGKEDDVSDALKREF